MGKKTLKISRDNSQCFGYTQTSWLTRARADKKDHSSGNALVVASNADCPTSEMIHATKRSYSEWQVSQIDAALKAKEVYCTTSKEGPTWFVRPKSKPTTESCGRSEFARFRDLVGQCFTHEDIKASSSIHLISVSLSQQSHLGSLVGLELGAYTFRAPSGDKLPQFVADKSHAPYLEQAAQIGVAMNTARHLTNQPPNILNPESFAHFLGQLVEDCKDFKLDILEGDQLAKQGLALLYAVGQASHTPARLVHLTYKGGAKSAKAFAAVGKGITFDSGGLDIKTAAGMRLMKKDMGGSAALAGFATWLKQAGPKINCDLYFALAENSISANAYRPGDIYKSRAGIKVEIHNTDAEGRLVMADALDYATKREKFDAPEVIFDFSTLTGAMRVAIGTDIYGLFANEDARADKVLTSAAALGDRGWKFPLVRDYEFELRSTFADISNASNSGYAGAIVAALFLEKFVNKTPWVHIDMHAWTERPFGCFAEAGATGQGVATLIAHVLNDKN